METSSSKNDMDGLIQGIENEKNNRFKYPWIKLDKGSKLNRLYLFIKTETCRLELDSSEEKQLKSLVLNLFNSNTLNKSSEIDYCLDNYEIKTIKNLIFDETKRRFNYNPPKKKKTENNNSKSKTNIEKHFSNTQKKK